MVSPPFVTAISANAPYFSLNNPGAYALQKNGQSYVNPSSLYGTTNSNSVANGVIICLNVELTSPGLGLYNLIVNEYEVE